MANEMILIIDDSADTRLVLSLQLKTQGYRTVFAADALEAITRARQAQPDAILLDLGLPGSNGFLVLERLKATATLAPIPVIIVSAEATAGAQAKAFAIGAAAYLQKPVGQRTLVETVEQALAASRELVKKGSV
jgi:CheY-like chemotaxis protein